VKLTEIDPPRMFEVGLRGAKLAHVADVQLEPDEVLTLKTPSGTELDIARKEWGYYGSPSLNGRLRDFGLRAALALGVPRSGEEAPRMYLMLVEDGREEAFAEYLEAESMRVLAWLDSDEAVAEAARQLEKEAD
jgi:hypothetical protein